MKTKILGVSLLAAILAAGCSSIQVHREFDGESLVEGEGQALAHLHSDVWGLYFLGFESMPVITGSYKKPGDWRMFRHTVSTGKASRMVTSAAQEMGADKVIDLTTDWDSTWQTFTLIFWLKEAQASGNAIRISPPDEEAELVGEEVSSEEED